MALEGLVGCPWLPRVATNSIYCVSLKSTRTASGEKMLSRMKSKLWSCSLKWILFEELIGGSVINGGVLFQLHQLL